MATLVEVVRVARPEVIQGVIQEAVQEGVQEVIRAATLAEAPVAEAGVELAGVRVEAPVEGPEPAVAIQETAQVSVQAGIPEIMPAEKVVAKAAEIKAAVAHQTARIAAPVLAEPALAAVVPRAGVVAAHCFPGLTPLT